MPIFLALLYAHLLIFLAASVLWSMTQRFVDHSPSPSLSVSLWQCMRECGLFLYNPHILAESFMQLLATERVTAAKEVAVGPLRAAQ